jgi:hypothetical protein
VREAWNDFANMVGPMLLCNRMLLRRRPSGSSDAHVYYHYEMVEPKGCPMLDSTTISSISIGIERQRSRRRLLILLVVARRWLCRIAICRITKPTRLERTCHQPTMILHLPTVLYRSPPITKARRWNSRANQKKRNIQRLAATPRTSSTKRRTNK